MYEGTIYVGGSVASRGADAEVEEMTGEDVDYLGTTSIRSASTPDRLRLHEDPFGSKALELLDEGARAVDVGALRVGRTA